VRFTGIQIISFFFTILLDAKLYIRLLITGRLERREIIFHFSFNMELLKSIIFPLAHHAMNAEGVNIMNPRSNSQRKRNQVAFQKKIVRCGSLQRPVYEHETCTQYAMKAGSEAQKICKNCKHSF